MTFNSTHASILAIAAITIASMAFSIEFTQYATVVSLLGAYAGIREYKRVQNQEGENTQWYGAQEVSLDEVV